MIGVIKKSVYVGSMMIVALFIISGCGNTDQVNAGKGSLQNKQVSDVLSEQVNQEQAQQEKKQQEEAQIVEIAEKKLNQDIDISVKESPMEVEIPKSDSDVDYDLSAMNKDMVYATVYQMMVGPEDYEGKMVRMQGKYYATYIPEEEQYYHVVIIKDALACCAQGIEFVWGDGSHVYPDDYPEQESEVVVTGRFETYRSDVDGLLYCHLVEATMETIK